MTQTIVAAGSERTVAVVGVLGIEPNPRPITGSNIRPRMLVAVERVAREVTDDRVTPKRGFL